MPKNNRSRPQQEAREKGVFDKTTITLLLVGFAAIGLTALVVNTTPKTIASSGAALVQSEQVEADSSQHADAQASSTKQVWATSAPGRVEPKGGAVDIRPEASGRVTAVYADAGDKLKAGDIIAELRDDSILAKLAQARAEVAVRIGERDEEGDDPKDKPAPMVVQRRKAADAYGAAEEKLFQARKHRDEVYLDKRAGRASEEQLDKARTAIDDAQKQVTETAKKLADLRAKDGMPAPTRLDSGLTLARADLRLAEIAFLDTRVRAPFDGTLLRQEMKVGEMVSSTGPAPVAQIGDMSAIQINAEVPERDISKVFLGQAVIVRSNAYEGKEFNGKVVEIAPAVGSPGMRAQGHRQQIDAEVLEVKIDLEGKPEIKPGMRVDVFFKSGREVSAHDTGKTLR